MNLKFAVAAFVFTLAPAIGHAQTGSPPPPKPTMADVKKVVQEIASDKKKVQAYCAMGALNEQMAQADQKKDNKALEALSQKLDSLAQTLGPDYIAMMEGLDQVDENSAEGKAIATAFDPLDQQCGGK
jgi:hypothetical protein